MLSLEKRNSGRVCQSLQPPEKIGAPGAFHNLKHRRLCLEKETFFFFFTLRETGDCHRLPSGGWGSAHGIYFITSLSQNPEIKEFITWFAGNRKSLIALNIRP